MGRLTRDGTDKLVSGDQILRRERGQGKLIFPLQLTTSKIGNHTRLIHTLLYGITIHKYIHTPSNLEIDLIIYNVFMPSIFQCPISNNSLVEVLICSVYELA